MIDVCVNVETIIFYYNSKIHVILISDNFYDANMFQFHYAFKHHRSQME